MSLERAKWAAVAAAAVLAFTAFLGDARAQSFTVKQFSCTTTPFGVNVDVSGLGHTDVCITGTATVDLNCACVGGGGNCPTDAKKQTTPQTFPASQSVEPKNGRVTTSFTLPFNPTDSLCTAPQCGSGQTTKLISWDTSPPTGSPATFEMCTTTTAPGLPCNCTDGLIAGPLTCGPTSDIVFAGKHGSCLALFP